MSHYIQLTCLVKRQNSDPFNCDSLETEVDLTLAPYENRTRIDVSFFHLKYFQREEDYNDRYRVVDIKPRLRLVIFSFGLMKLNESLCVLIGGLLPGLLAVKNLDEVSKKIHEELTESLMHFYDEKSGDEYTHIAFCLIEFSGKSTLRLCLNKAKGNFDKEATCLRHIFNDDYFWSR